MYRWRELTTVQREAAIADRQSRRVPWHGPPHYESDCQLYLITAACYEHHSIIGKSPDRMSQFEEDLLGVCEAACQQIFAWLVLPNHDHLLLHVPKVKPFLTLLGKLHGKPSFAWNGEDQLRGRQVWCRAGETAMKSERHFWATFNYVLHNAVRHQYVKQWQDWPDSNAARYLAEVGREVALQRWNDYPVLNYGDIWDPPEM